MACPRSDVNKEQALKLTTSFLLQNADRYKDGWLLDEIIPKALALNRDFSGDTQMKGYARHRRDEYAECTTPEWKEYNNEYKDRATYTAEVSIPQCKRRPLLSWGLGSVVTFLGR